VAGELQAIEDALQDYAPDVRAVAGAIVTIDCEGETVIYRGLLREADGTHDLIWSRSKPQMA
jgi:ParB family chromosome partitioning protein